MWGFLILLIQKINLVVDGLKTTFEFFCGLIRFFVVYIRY